ncbi:MAG TPA: acyl-CoA dehydrogenase family protein [Steroidobacteraceae bacterium]|nr:acyl-CoA dehydrogenase family protein [Steroidobacteraceae bacterium]
MNSQVDIRAGAPATALPTLKTRAEAVATVRALLPRIRARARQVDADRCVPTETVNELMDAGLFGIVAPRTLGGSELGLATLVDVTAEIASVCGSTGWVFGVLAGHSWLLNLFPIEAQQDVMTNTRALLATVFRFAGTVRPVPGGYRLTGGEGRFCSGVDHADWVIIGNQVLRDGEPAVPTFFVIPRSDIAEVVDDWFVAGMRGTGSKTIKVPEAFIPEHRAVRMEDMAAGTSPGSRVHRGAIYRMSWRDVAPFSLIGVPVGIGRSAVSVFAESLRKSMSSFTPEQIAEQSATLTRLAVAAADIDASYAMIIENAARIDAAASPGDLSAEQRARIPRDWAYAAQRSRHAVTSLFEAGGGGATYDYSELQRVWRDANAAAQHVAFTWDSAMSGYGRVLAGAPPAKYGPKGR